MSRRSKSFTKFKPEFVKFKMKMYQRKFAIGGDRSPCSRSFLTVLRFSAIFAYYDTFFKVLCLISQDIYD